MSIIPPNQSLADRLTSASQGASTFSGTVTVGVPIAFCLVQRNIDRPCDVVGLNFADMRNTGRSIAATARFHNTPVPAGTPEPYAKLLATYDVILETMAARLSDNNPDDCAKIEVAGRHEGDGFCGDPNHPSFTFSSPGYAMTKGLVGQRCTLKPIRLFAPSMKAGAGKWIAPFWGFRNDVEEFAVIYSACGVRMKWPVNQALSGLVRVYPREVYVLSIDIPGFEKSANWSHDAMAEPQSEKAARATKVATAKAKKQKPTVISRLISAEKLVHSGAATIDSAAKMLSLTRNGREIAQDSWLLSTVIKAAKAYVELHKKLTEVREILESISGGLGVKAGVDVDFELSLFAGRISGEWGNKLGNGGYRYLSVDPYLNISVDMLIVSAAISVWYGLRVTEPKWLSWCRNVVGQQTVDPELFVLAVSGQIVGDINACATFNLPDLKPAKIDAHLGASLSALLKTNAVGIHMTFSGTVTTGLDFTGILSCTLESPPSIDGTLTFNGIIVSGTYRGEDDDLPPYSVKFEIIPPGAQIWSGTWPEA